MVWRNLFPGQQQRLRCGKCTCGYSEGRGGWDNLGHQHSCVYTTIYTPMHKIDNQWENAVIHRELSSLMTQRGETGVRWEGQYKRGDIFIHMANSLHYTAEINIVKQLCATCLVSQSCLTLCNPMECSPPGSSDHRDSSGKNSGVGCHALLQGILPTQGSKPGLPHCRKMLYCLSHQGSPKQLYSNNRIKSRSREEYRKVLACMPAKLLQ